MALLGAILVLEIGPMVAFTRWRLALKRGAEPDTDGIVDLRPLNESDDELLSSLAQQDDVWEFIGTLPLPDDEHVQHLFAVMEGPASVGVAGLVQSRALDGKDFELLCAMRSEVQLRGFAKQACKLALAWAFETQKLERVIACIDDNNQGARSIAAKLGMKELCAQPPHRTVFVKYRDEGPSKS